MEKQFIVKSKKYEVFFCDNGQIEVYELKNPGKTGFIFNDIKEFNTLINSMTDISEKYMLENE